MPKVAQAREAFHVRLPDRSRFGDRPRLISALSGAINDQHEIEVQLPGTDHNAFATRRLRPAVLVISLPRVQLAAWRADHESAAPGQADDPPPQDPASLELINIDRIAKLKRLDSRFTPLPIDLSSLALLPDDTSG